MKSLSLLLTLISGAVLAPSLDAQSATSNSFRRETRHTSFDDDRLLIHDDKPSIDTLAREREHVARSDIQAEQLLGGRRKHVHERDEHQHTRLEYVPGHFEGIQKEIWIECRDEVIREQVCVAGHYEDFERTEYSSGRKVTVPTRVWVDAYMKICERVVHHPGYFKTVCERVWVPGRFIVRGSRDCR